MKKIMAPGKEIAGLKKKKMKNNYDDDYDAKKIGKSRMSKFSLAELMACIKYKWKSQFFKMKRDIGMAFSTKN